jgi:hypothetical protein
MRLIVNYYVDSDQERQKEIEKCLEINSKIFDEVILLVDDPNVFKPGFLNVYIKNRPQFNDYFNYSSNGWNVIANSDIYFDETIKLVDKYSSNHFIALTRYDIGKDGKARFLNRLDSQDAWIFKGKTNFEAPFNLGVPGCDNVLAHIAQKAGYKVINPSLSIKTYHLHNSGKRSYTMRDKLPPPYLLLTPSL